MATLAFTIQADDTVLLVDDPTGLPLAAMGGADDFVLVCESEKILVQRRTGSTLWNLVRGYDGTTAARHLGGASVTVQTAAAATGLPEGIVVVTDYGADPTGVADSTSAIQDALDDLDTTYGGTVIFPLGKYKVSSTLTLPGAGVILRGLGTKRYTTSGGLDYEAGSTLFTDANPGITLFQIGKFDATNTWGAPLVENLNFEDQAGLSTLLHIRHANNGIIRNCGVTGALIGILLDAGSDDAGWWHIEDCTIDFNGTGVKTATSGPTSPNFIISGGHIFCQGSQIGIHQAVNAYYVRIAETKFDLHDDSVGIYWESAKFGTISNVHCEMAADCTANARFVKVRGGMFGLDIIAPQVSNSTSAPHTGIGIDVDGLASNNRAARVKVLGGNINACNIGVLLGANTAACEINGTGFSGSTTDDIQITSGASANTLLGILSDTSLGSGLTDSGTATIVIGWSRWTGSTAAQDVSYINSDLYSKPGSTATLGANGRFARVSCLAVNPEHVAAATPTGGSSGDIKVGNGKIWVNDAGTWKSVAIA